LLVPGFDVRYGPPACVERDPGEGSGVWRGRTGTVLRGGGAAQGGCLWCSAQRRVCPILTNRSSPGWEGRRPAASASDDKHHCGRLASALDLRDPDACPW